MPSPVNTTAASIVGYNRIEPRMRVLDFDLSLANPVHDAMWMLTQQWRIGEFRGKDGGSLVNAKMEVTSARLNRFQPANGDALAYAVDDAPLEAMAERLTITFDLATRMQMGRHWLRLLRAEGLGNVYDSWFSTEFPLEAPTTAEGLSNKPAQEVRTAVMGRLPDGAAIFEFVQTNQANDFAGVGSSHYTAVDDAIAAFKTWFAALYQQPVAGESSWLPSHLEYQFQYSAPVDETSSADQTVMSADEYNGSSADWYTGDLDENLSATLAEEPTDTGLNTDAVESEVKNVVPSPVRFHGMPKARWWEFEDRVHEIGKVVTRKNDIVRMLVTDFGLTYSNNWFLIPHKLGVGTLTEINGLMVTDSFGRNTLVSRAGSGEDDDWQRWNLFTLSRTGEDDVAADERLYLPPSLSQAPDSSVNEKVVFLRDEMANLVWGVEETLNNELGGGVSGKEAWNLLLDYYRENPFPESELSTGTYSGNAATIAYRINNTIPENWIPFVPIATGNPDRSIMLQRATMYRKIDANRVSELLRPRTSILSEVSPYFINEEEITKTGLTITGSFQRTRWHKGAVVVWYGRSVQPGRGQGASGLKFDYLDVKEKDTPDLTNFLNQEDSTRIILEENTGYLEL